MLFPQKDEESQCRDDQGNSSAIAEHRLQIVSSDGLSEKRDALGHHQHTAECVFQILETMDFQSHRQGDVQVTDKEFIQSNRPADAIENP